MGNAPVVAFGGTSNSPEPVPSGQAGTPSEPRPHAAEPCEDPQPSPYGGGFEHCADGSFRRPQPAACVSALPRNEPVKDKLLDECEHDADCTEKAHGSCELGECLYGCVLDSECEEGQVCLCGSVIGRCQYVGCRSDADCSADYPCTGNVQKLDPYLEVQCQTPLDECQSDNDCGNSLDFHWHCVSEDGQRRCRHIYIG